jgi:phospholipase C
MSDRDPRTPPGPISRRGALKGIGAGTVGLVTLGCGAEAEEIPPLGEETAAPAGDAPAAGATPAESPVSPAEPEPPVLTPKELLGGIDHIVVVMMENRSFDHFLGALQSDPGYAAKADVEGLSGSESNPMPDGTSVPVWKMSNFEPKDPPHKWEDCHAQFNGGKNDGFVKEHAKKHGDAVAPEAIGYHDRSQIPLYYWLADNFAICDHWYSSVLAPTWPNRFYLHAATSKGKKGNTPFLANAPPTIWDRLKDLGLTYKNYAAGITTWYVGGFAGKVLSLNPSAPIGQFFDAAKTGNLPAFSLIDPDYMASDDHPSHNILRGQAFVGSIYKALAASPAWSRTLLIVTYDEHGGFYDHVAPPKTVDDDPEFQQLGIRVPTFVIGPTVKKGYVCKKTLEHVSVPATLATRFGIQSLNARMDATSDVSDCIDPKKVAAPSAPPPGMPEVAMSLQSALYDGVGPTSQPMLQQMVESGAAPVVDPRSDQERIGSWLRHAEELGVVRIVGR